MTEQLMVSSGDILVLVGTTKGAFLFRTDPEHERTEVIASPGRCGPVTSVRSCSGSVLNRKAPLVVPTRTRMSPLETMSCSVISHPQDHARSRQAHDRTPARHSPAGVHRLRIRGKGFAQAGPPLPVCS